MKIAVIGATGAVGQKAVRLILEDPELELGCLAASPSKAGKTYCESVAWQEGVILPDEVGEKILVSPEAIKEEFVISALPAEVAKEVEPELLKQGKYVFSNASAFRREETVPILIPEVNPHHLELLDQQPWRGKIVTNSNCCVAGLAPPLNILRGLGRIEHVSVVTLQSLSGAGFKGPSALQMASNLLPGIEGEEEKIAWETKKILGAQFPITVHTTRVPIPYGHTLILHLLFKEKQSLEEVNYLLKKEQERFPQSYAIYEKIDAPQPGLHITPNDYRIHIGRIKLGENSHCVGLVTASHNLVRGAAGAALLNLKFFIKTRLTSKENLEVQRV